MTRAVLAFPCFLTYEFHPWSSWGLLMTPNYWEIEIYGMMKKLNYRTYN